MITSGSCRMMYFRCVGEAQAVVVVGRHLIDARQPILDRVFDGDDVPVRTELRFESMAYIVVLLPEPVGPVTTIMPCGLSITAGPFRVRAVIPR